MERRDDEKQCLGIFEYTRLHNAFEFSAHPGLPTLHVYYPPVCCSLPSYLRQSWARQG